jgi:hypothetical protein
MFIKEYISKDYPAFNTSDSIQEANEMAKEFGYSHIFIKKKGFYLGALSQQFLAESPDGDLASLEHHYEKFALVDDGNILDSIKLFHTFDSNIVPIINKLEKYQGYLSCDDVFSEFAKYPLFSENGALLVVQINNRSYSMTDICKIVESNNAKIYGCYISAFIEDEVQISLKISSENLSSIDETFERYGYTIVQKFYDDEKEELLKDRFGFFQKYMEF